jgi:hypothetical protein
MPDIDRFSAVPANLEHIFEDLLRREPIFHTEAFGSTVEDFAAIMAPDYWEVGASGRRYSREFILEWLSASPPVRADSAGWEASEHGLRALSPDTYLLTYTLRQRGRLTLRATIWHRSPEGWQILYHQGTIVTGQLDDTAPSDAERAGTEA